MISMLKDIKPMDICCASFILMDCRIEILPAKWLLFEIYGLFYNRTWEHK